MASAAFESSPRRRAIVKSLVALLMLPIAATTLVLGRARARRTRRAVSVPYPDRDGVSFHGDVILVRSRTELLALSARCPHLGCRISRHDGEELVCPCHGSRFSLRGRRRRGPAAGDLTPLPFERRRNADGVEVVDVELAG